jgi:hypothetical protein
MRSVSLLCALLGVACGSGPAGSCSFTAASANVGSTCVDFTKGYSAGSAKNTCGSSGAYAATACPTQNRVGHCSLASPDNIYSQVKSYYAPTMEALAQSDCTGAGGMFAAN